MIVSFGWEGEKYKQFIDYARKHENSVDRRKVIFLDIGAHWGLYAIRATLEPYIDEFYCFEPDPRNLSQLYANLFLNQLNSKVKVVEKAISSTDGSVFFELSPASNRGTSHIVDSSKSNTLEVKSAKIDSLFKFQNNLVIIKMDIEGNEIEAVKGMADTLSKNTVIMMIECNGKLDILKEYLLHYGVKYIGDLLDSKGEIDYLFSNCD